MSIRGTFSSPRRRIGFPSTRTRSRGPTRWPKAARAPLTLTRPAAIAASIARREPAPERARTFCSFSAGPVLDGAGLGRLCGGLVAALSGLFGRRLRVGRGDLREIKGFDYVFQRRQLFERAQAQVVQEGLGGAIQGRTPRHFLMPEHLDPVALLEPTGSRCSGIRKC